MFSFLMKTSKFMGDDNAWPSLFHPNTLFPPVFKHSIAFAVSACSSKEHWACSSALSDKQCGVGPVGGAETMEVA